MYVVRKNCVWIFDDVREIIGLGSISGSVDEDGYLVVDVVIFVYKKSLQHVEKYGNDVVVKRFFVCVAMVSHVSVAKTKILGYYTIFGLDVKWFVFLCLKI
jgi:hypothetical protein